MLELRAVNHWNSFISMYYVFDMLISKSADGGRK